MNNTLKNLREAVALSPDNAILRKMLAKELMNQSYWSEAEMELKVVLRLTGEDQEAKLWLAQTYWALDKKSVAAVIAEELEEQGCDTPAFTFLLAQLALENKDLPKAKAYYEKAIDANLALKDTGFEAQLKNTILDSGMAMGNTTESSEEDAPFFADIEKPAISFEQVGGLESIKKEIALKIIHPLKNPQIYEAYGKKIGGGVLLYGPPGCGKTLLARATAGEINASFINVGISDILDMWVGSSERNLHEIFQKARASKPCVLFFDEVDALGASRSNMQNSSSRFIVNQFLDELDGIRYSNDGLLILAATNSPWYLDAAFRRPGRFDRIIFVQPPDAPAREAILNLYLEQIPKEAGINISKLVKQTKDYSGADLKAIIDIAVESKLEESLMQNKVVPITQKDLLNAIKRHQPSTKDWLATAKNHVLYANQSGLYDDVMKYLNLKK
ncbi:AAA family ATPase [Aureispira sp. CCB-E]|uniref:AAA family ATPase n=1 Tax=Aureispira sp. CCB-E TaxID=3051121 RepID=UPI0028693700|nr:AAA family ATPase [Aureispira sp. CCB-E]WMX16868.1 AAA family ATPase [Aureispira sp. CCB-E]